MRGFGAAHGLGVITLVAFGCSQRPVNMTIDPRCGVGAEVGVTVYADTSCEELKRSLDRTVLSQTTLDLSKPSTLRFAPGQRTVFAATRDDAGNLTCRACVTKEFLRESNDPLALDLAPVEPGDDCVTSTPLALDQLATDQLLSASYANDFAAACVSAAKDRVYRIHLEDAGARRLVFRVWSTFAHVAFLASPECLGLASERDGACGRSVANTTAAKPAHYSVLDLPSVEGPGDLYFVVESESADALGTFELIVESGSAVASPVEDRCDSAAPLPLTTSAAIEIDASNLHDDFSLSCAPGDRSGVDAVLKLDLPLPAPSSPLRYAVSAVPAAYSVTGLSSVDDLQLALGDSCGQERSPYCVAGQEKSWFVNFPATLLQEVAAPWVIIDTGRSQFGDPSQPLPKVSARVDSNFGNTDSGYVLVEVATPLIDLAPSGDIPGFAPTPIDNEFLIDLPFDFFFMGRTFHKGTDVVHVGDNGYVTFGPAGMNPAIAPTHDCTLASRPINAIAVFWDDLRAVASGPSSLRSATHSTGGVVDRLTIEWRAFDFNCAGMRCGYSVHFQLELHKSGVIAMRYLARSPNLDRTKGGEAMFALLGESTVYMKSCDAVPISRGTSWYFVPPTM